MAQQNEQPDINVLATKYATKALQIPTEQTAKEIASEIRAMMLPDTKEKELFALIATKSDNANYLELVSRIRELTKG